MSLFYDEFGLRAWVVVALCALAIAGLCWFAVWAFDHDEKECAKHSGHLEQTGQTIIVQPKGGVIVTPVYSCVGQTQ